MLRANEPPVVMPTFWQALLLAVLPAAVGAAVHVGLDYALNVIHGEDEPSPAPPKTPAPKRKGKQAKR